MSRIKDVVDTAAAKAIDTIYSIGALVAHNRKQLERGTILDPLNHPSYSTKKIAALTKAGASRDRAIKSAHTRYENAANAA